MFRYVLIFTLIFIGCAETEVIYKDSEFFNDNDNELSECPEEMVAVGNICMDIYEASRVDATADEQGTSEEKAVSKKGVLPWMVNPMTDEHFETFKKACIASGKRLCRNEEWTATCQGPEELTYSWGNDYDRKICNNVDTYCDEHCAENDISQAECNTFPDCGYDYYCFKVVPTGSFENCRNFADIYDISGNVWEITDNGEGYSVKGGAFNCANAQERLKCTYSAGWTKLYAGFRCCKDR